MITMKRPSYWGILPARVRYDKRLSGNAKVLFTELSALSEKEGYCFATNGYFAGLYEVSEVTVSRWISDLEQAGHVRVEIDQADGNTRKIWIIEAEGVITKKLRPSQHSRGQGHNKKPSGTDVPLSESTTRSSPQAEEDEIRHESLEERLLHAWGRDGRVSRLIMEKFVDLGRKAGWEKVFAAIDEAAYHGKRSFAYVEAIVSPQDKKKILRRTVVVEGKDRYFGFQSWLMQNGHKEGWNAKVLKPGQQFEFIAVKEFDIVEQYNQFRRTIR